LLSYSLPLSRYNIEKDINNIFNYSINEEQFIIDIPSGKYSINELIEFINNNINNNNIKLKLNIEQKIIFESIDTNDILFIYENNLSKNNLGFINYNNDNNSNIIIADNTWDLRINDKIYLYLDNLVEDIPFGILFYNNKLDYNAYSVSQFKFETPYKLDRLDINFKDIYGNNIQFNNLPHTLSFLIEKVNNKNIEY
jgi:hypothetical protein